MCEKKPLLNRLRQSIWGCCNNYSTVLLKNLTSPLPPVPLLTILRLLCSIHQPKRPIFSLFDLDRFFGAAVGELEDVPRFHSVFWENSQFCSVTCFFCNTTGIKSMSYSLRLNRRPASAGLYAFHKLGWIIMVQFLPEGFILKLDFYVIMLRSSAVCWKTHNQ